MTRKRAWERASVLCANFARSCTRPTYVAGVYFDPDMRHTGEIGCGGRGQEMFVIREGGGPFLQWSSSNNSLSLPRPRFLGEGDPDPGELRSSYIGAKAPWDAGTGYPCSPPCPPSLTCKNQVNRSVEPQGSPPPDPAQTWPAGVTCWSPVHFQPPATGICHCVHKVQAAAVHQMVRWKGA